MVGKEVEKIRDEKKEIIDLFYLVHLEFSVCFWHIKLEGYFTLIYFQVLSEVGRTVFTLGWHQPAVGCGLHLEMGLVPSGFTPPAGQLPSCLFGSLRVRVFSHLGSSGKHPNGVGGKLGERGGQLVGV